MHFARHEGRLLRHFREPDNAHASAMSLHLPTQTEMPGHPDCDLRA